MNVVYVLTNSAMPGLVKIGHTTQEDANVRIGQLYTTGVPVPFDLAFAGKVQNAEDVEKASTTKHMTMSSDAPRLDAFHFRMKQATNPLEFSSIWGY